MMHRLSVPKPATRSVPAAARRVSASLKPKGYATEILGPAGDLCEELEARLQLALLLGEGQSGQYAVRVRVGPDLDARVAQSLQLVEAHVGLAHGFGLASGAEDLLEQGGQHGLYPRVGKLVVEVELEAADRLVVVAVEAIAAREVQGLALHVGAALARELVVEGLAEAVQPEFGDEVLDLLDLEKALLEVGLRADEDGGLRAVLLEDGQGVLVDIARTVVEGDEHARFVSVSVEVRCAREVEAPRELLHLSGKSRHVFVRAQTEPPRALVPHEVIVDRNAPARVGGHRRRAA